MGSSKMDVTLRTEIQQILHNISSPVARVDHNTGNSFVNDIKPSDSPADVLQKVENWYNNMEASADEVFPDLFVGNAKSVISLEYLRSLGITHIVNTAAGDGVASVDVDKESLKELGISYYGIDCNDLASVAISDYFQDTANFIEEALSTGGSVVVNCFAGVSRSATIAIAYLMQKKDLKIVEAFTTVKKHRDVHPNPGFVSQLIQLQENLQKQQ